MESLEFKNEIEYEKYLRKEFDSIAKSGEYNIFLHCVTTYSAYYCSCKAEREEEIRRRVAGIFKNGLDLDGVNSYGTYGSIKCTAKFYGSISEIKDLSTIANYEYHSNSKIVHNIILLIPKYIDMGGEVLDFSTINKKVGNGSQHNKSCWFDVVKDRFSPTEFIFGYQVYDTEAKTYKFCKNERHLAFLGDNERKELKKYFVEKIKEVKQHCKDKYNVENTEDILAKMTEEHMFIINDFLMDP